MPAMRPLAHAPTGAAPSPGNAILAGLSPSGLRLLEPMDYLRLPARYVLFEAGDALKHLYFPASGEVSFLQADKRGLMPEIAHVGAEGVVGVTALLGAERARHRAVMQIGGEVYRVSLATARRAFDEDRAFRLLALGFIDAMMRQLAQNVICKLGHSVEQQFCQRLLLYADRLAGAALEMTHEHLAETLGARRQGITETARRLQALQLIAYSRGRISVLDRAALERFACECYRLVRGVGSPINPA